MTAAALRRADLLYKKGDTSTAAREAAFALLNDEVGPFDGGELLKKCLAAVVQDPYGSLGLEPGAADKEIKKAYRKLALKLHPDKNEKTTALFQAVKAAYDKLQDGAGKAMAARRFEKARQERERAKREYATPARLVGSGSAATPRPSRRAGSPFDASRRRRSYSNGPWTRDRPLTNRGAATT